MNCSSIPVFKKKQYKKSPEIKSGKPLSCPLLIVGCGPVGLAMALDLARRGHQVVLVTALDFIAAGSKAICFAKQSLDLFDRLGIGERAIKKGVIWNVGKVFWGDSKEPVYEFDMLPVKNQKNPGFINIQQYYIEDYLCDELEKLPNVEIRWGHTVTTINTSEKRNQLQVKTRDGDYQICAEYVLACDGARSSIRTAMGLDFQGRVFEDNFLIADVKFKQTLPSERWFWFDPPFNPGKTALLHKQPDDVWRLDFQLGSDSNRAEAIKSENVAPLVKGMLGPDVDYVDEWLSVYTFQCRRMERFVHDQVIFIGDSAHLVSPFGARGCNGGLADVDNLGWKLDLVIRGQAPKSLLDSYNDERVQASDENIMHSSRSTDFMTPKDSLSLAFRDAVLELSSEFEFARPFINSGRLSTPPPYLNSRLLTSDQAHWSSGIKPGYAALDAPIHEHNKQWLLSSLNSTFCLLHFGSNVPVTDIPTLALPSHSIAAQRYGADQGCSYLIRPDQVVAARWKNATAADINTACQRAKGLTI